MSEAEDAESKTEEATEKKINDTVAQGRTPISRDVGAAFGALALLGVLAFAADLVAPKLTETAGLLLANSATLPLRAEADAMRYLQAVTLEAAGFLAPLLTTFVVAGLAASFVQGVPLVAFERVRPDFARISPIAGMRRIFSVGGVVELGKAIGKLAIVGGSLTLAASSDWSAFVDAMRMEPSRLPELALKLVMHLASVVACALIVVAALDFAWTKFKWRRDLRMSRQELKEELKQAQGDPLIKARMRSLAMDRSRRRMMASVPDASFVVANPTHYAIALRYVRAEDAAPLVLAKGKDLVALRIREIAEAHGVPVLERKELARGMFDLVEVDRLIPPELYHPVAEIIHFLHETGRRGY